jgi:hypothetical protein
MQKLHIVILGFGTARQKMALERWTNPKPFGVIVDRAAILLCVEGFWICLSFNRPFSIAKCQILISRFATFSSLFVASEPYADFRQTNTSVSWFQYNVGVQARQ